MTDSPRPSHDVTRSSRWSAFVRLLIGGVVDEAIRAAVTRERAELDARYAASMESLLAWIRGAETHLAALQADHDRLRIRCGEAVGPQDRTSTRASLYERLDDLERAQTALAMGMAKARINLEMT